MILSYFKPSPRVSNIEIHIMMTCDADQGSLNFNHANKSFFLSQIYDADFKSGIIYAGIGVV